MITKARVLLIFPLAFVVLALGCGGGNPNAPSKVSGKVTYNSQPVTGGKIEFYPKAGGPSYPGGISPDGAYTVTDVPSGEVKVTVSTEELNPAKKKGGALAAKMTKMMGPIPEGAQVVKGAYVKIPDKYTKPDTTPLTTTLNKGSNTFDANLTD